MKKKKGFTLAELIGVIIVLGLIAVIILPKTKKMVNNAKKKSFEDSAYALVRAAEQYYNRLELNDEELTDTIIDFTNANDVAKLKFTGDVPASGKMSINKDGDIALAISNGKYCSSKEYNSSSINTEDFTSEDDCIWQKTGKVLKDIATDTNNQTLNCFSSGYICERGTVLKVKVNETSTINFLVLNDAGDEIILLMQNYLGSQGTDSAWYASGTNTTYSNGPVTALNYLREKTKTWTNIDAFDYTLESESSDMYFRPMEIKNARAKLPTFYQVTTFIGCTTTQNSNSCSAQFDPPTFAELNSNVARYSVYWLSDGHCFYYYTNKSMTNPYRYIKSASVKNEYGIRPVITIKK